MKQFFLVISKTKLESSILVALLLLAGLIANFHNTSPYISMFLIASAVFLAALGFMTTSIRENYNSLLSQKDEIIKSLGNERRRESKHNENLRAEISKQISNGWEQSVSPNEDVQNTFY